MRLVHLDNVKKDMKLAKPISDSGRYLLREGQNNLQRFRKRLKNLGIKYIYVEDEISKDIEVDDVIRESTREEARQFTREFIDDISKEKTPDFIKAKKQVETIIDDIMDRQDVVINLYDIKTADNYTYAHSVNVAVISILLGKKVGLNFREIKKLGLGALVHDVGKANIPADILKKPGKLNDEEYKIIQEHARLGYDKLKDFKEIKATSLSVVLSHHENFQGDGYPRGVKGEELHIFPRIAAIADVFDALTSDRVYRERWSIREAADFIVSRSGEKFDPELVKYFMRYITLYPSGITVRLNDGRKAVVVDQNEGYPRRPVVRLLDTGEEIDLTDKLNLIIAEDKVS